MSAAIGKPAVGAGSVYWFASRDGTGAFLDGGNTYKLNVPGPVPGKLFWSMTVYDVNTRCLIATDQNKAAIRSLVDKPQANADGSYDLYFGPKAPAGFEKNWIPSVSGKAWFPYFRLYAPTEAHFDRAWILPDFEKVK